MSLDLATQAQLTVLYSQPQRVYHALAHIHHCMREYHDWLDNDEDLSALKSEDIMAIEFAIWFHDAIYDPMAAQGQNEKESSELAFNWLWFHGDLYRPMARKVSEMINKTSMHEPVTPAEKYFSDIDLAIFAASLNGLARKHYIDYTKEIRQEYRQVPDDLFAQGRMKVLQSFMNRPRIYQTDYFYKKYEATARENIQRELDFLSSHYGNPSTKSNV